MIQTLPGTYHLHTDGTHTTPEFDAWCDAHHLAAAHFTGHPPGYQHYEPVRHRTAKLTSWQEFQDLFMTACEVAAKTSFKGYVEGEFIARVVEIPERPFAELPMPFQVVRRHLTVEEGFREGEFHLTFDADASDQRRIDQLLEGGLYGAYEVKDDGRRYLVLSMQGYMKDVVPMTYALESFLKEGGGLVRCRLKLERAIANRLFGVTQENLPPIADQVIWV